MIQTLLVPNNILDQPTNRSVRIRVRGGSHRHQTFNRMCCLNVKLLLVACFMGYCHYSFAQEKPTDVFRMAIYTPGYTDPPAGINGVVAHVMAQRGIKTEFYLVPSKRMPWSLQNGSIDSMQASALAIETRGAGGEDDFIQSTMPVFSYNVLIYYKPNNRWQPQWPPSGAMLDNSRGVTMNYNYLKLRGYNIALIPGYASGAKMVNYGRVDYWLDAIPVALLGPLIRGEDRGYRTEKYMDNPLFLLFNDDAKGRRFRDIWDEEVYKLYANRDQYRRVFLKDLESAYFSAAVEDYIVYLRENYPEFSEIQ